MKVPKRYLLYLLLFILVLVVGYILFKTRESFTSISKTDKVGIIAIALNEELYIDEWIQYHLAMGFDAIYIHDNHKDNPLKILEQRYPGKVFVTHDLRVPIQNALWKEAPRLYEKKLKYAAFLDIDEFIALKKHKNIKDFIRDHFKHRGALALNWVFFGSSGKERYEPLPVTQRFTRRERDVNPHVKSIVELAVAITNKDPHTFKFDPIFDARTLDAHGREIACANCGPTSDDIAYIAHMYTKSKEEFEKKAALRQADLGTKRTSGQVETTRKEMGTKMSEIEDTTVRDFYREFVLKQ